MHKALFAFLILAIIAVASYRMVFSDGVDNEYLRSQEKITVINQSRPSKGNSGYERTQGDGDRIINATQTADFPHGATDYQKSDFTRSIPKIDLFNTGSKNGFLRCDGAACTGRLVFRHDVSKGEIDAFFREMQSLDYLSPNGHDVYWVMDRQVISSNDPKEEYFTIRFEKK